MINEAIHLIRVSNLSLLRHEPGHSTAPRGTNPHGFSKAKPHRGPAGRSTSCFPPRRKWHLSIFPLLFFSLFPFKEQRQHPVPRHAMVGTPSVAPPFVPLVPPQAPTDPAGMEKRLFQQREFTSSKNVTFFGEGWLHAKWRFLGQIHPPAHPHQPQQLGSALPLPPHPGLSGCLWNREIPSWPASSPERLLSRLPWGWRGTGGGGSGIPPTSTCICWVSRLGACAHSPGLTPGQWMEMIFPPWGSSG